MKTKIEKEFTFKIPSTEWYGKKGVKIGALFIVTDILAGIIRVFPKRALDKMRTSPSNNKSKLIEYLAEYEALKQDYGMTIRLLLDGSGSHAQFPPIGSIIQVKGIGNNSWTFRLVCEPPQKLRP